MKDRIIAMLVGIVLLLFSSLLAQGPDTLWTRTYGGANWDYGRSVKQTHDGGYIIAGSSKSFGAGCADMYLIKTDSNGDSIWTKTYGGKYSEHAYSVEQTSDSGYIIVGTGINLIKTDTNGELIWSKRFPQKGHFASIGHSVQQTSDGGYLIVGTTYSLGEGSGDVYIVKTDSFGDTLWTETFGGHNLDEGWEGYETSDGSYIIVGHTWSFGAGECDVFLAKMDSNGNALWEKTYGGKGDDRGFSVCESADGGYAVTGVTFSYEIIPDTICGMRGGDIYLVRTDENGDTLWTNTYGGYSPEKGTSIMQIPEGGYVIAGKSHSHSLTNTNMLHTKCICVVKTNANGKMLWLRTYGCNKIDIDDKVSLDITNDNGFIVVGSVYGKKFDIYLVKLKSE